MIREKPYRSSGPARWTSLGDSTHWVRRTPLQAQPVASVMNEKVLEAVESVADNAGRPGEPPRPRGCTLQAMSAEEAGRPRTCTRPEEAAAVHLTMIDEFESAGNAVVAFMLAEMAEQEAERAGSISWGRAWSGYMTVRARSGESDGEIIP